MLDFFKTRYVLLLIASLVICSVSCKKDPGGSGGQRLKAPTELSAMQSGSSIVVSWKSVTEATDYNVYRNNSASGTYTQIGSTNDTIYIDNNPLDEANYYKVKAVNNTSESNYSDYVYCDFSEINILPEANVVLTDEESTLDEINMGSVVGTKTGELLLITGMKLGGDDSGKKLLIYVKGNSDGSYPVNMSPESLMYFDFGNIKGNTVIYYVSKTEYYLLVEGEITLSNTQEKMMKGTFDGKVIPAHELTSDVTPEKIEQLLYDSNINITGDFRAYSIKF
jgi:hypothetical protein